MGPIVFLLCPIFAFAGIEPAFPRGRIHRKTRCMGPYAGGDCNLTLGQLQSLLTHIYHGQTYARVDLYNPMPESTLFPSQGLRIWPLVFTMAATL